MKFLLNLIVLILFVPLCFCSKSILPEVNVKEYDGVSLLGMIREHLDQYAGFMPGDLHLRYDIVTRNVEGLKYGNSIFFLYQMGSIFDITEDRVFFLPCGLQHGFQFWGDDEDTHDEAVREMYKYIAAIDFSEEGKFSLPVWKSLSQSTENTLNEITGNGIIHTIQTLDFVIIEANSTTALVSSH